MEAGGRTRGLLFCLPSVPSSLRPSVPSAGFPMGLISERERQVERYVERYVVQTPLKAVQALGLWALKATRGVGRFAVFSLAVVAAAFTPPFRWHRLVE